MNQHPNNSVWSDIPRHMALVPVRRKSHLIRWDYKSVVLVGLLLIPVVILFVVLGGPGPFLRIP